MSVQQTMDGSTLIQKKARKSYTREFKLKYYCENNLAKLIDVERLDVGLPVKTKKVSKHVMQTQRKIESGVADGHHLHSHLAISLQLVMCPTICGRGCTSISAHPLLCAYYLYKHLLTGVCDIYCTQYYVPKQGVQSG